MTVSIISPDQEYGVTKTELKFGNPNVLGWTKSKLYGNYNATIMLEHHWFAYFKIPDWVQAL